MNILLQAVVDSSTLTDTAQRLTNTAAAANSDQLRFIDLLFKGGWVMIPLALLAFLGLVIFIERYITIKKAARRQDGLLSQVSQNVLAGRLDHAITLCKNNNSPLANMLQKGLKRIGRPIKDIETSIESVGKIEVSRLEKNVGILGIIAGIAPMLGFVGTIIGVITIFHEVSLKGVIEISTISGGLYQKMITSATGLIIGIMAYIGYHILNMMLDRIILRLEAESLEFIDLLEEPGQ